MTGRANPFAFAALYGFPDEGYLIHAQITLDNIPPFEEMDVELG